MIRLCEAMGALADLPREDIGQKATAVAVRGAKAPRILVLGGTGFIGRELVRQLTSSGRTVRLLVRNAAAIPEKLRTSESSGRLGIWAIAKICCAPCREWTACFTWRERM